MNIDNNLLELDINQINDFYESFGIVHVEDEVDVYENFEIVDVYDGDGVLEVEDEVDVDLENVYPLFPKKRKRESNSKENASNREQGLNYSGTKKIDDKSWQYDVEKNIRVIKERCTCKLSTAKSAVKCKEISDADRIQLFNSFWNLSWEAKKVYVCKSVERKETARQRDRIDATNSRRKFSYVYCLQNLRVCKTMFLNTLCIGERMVLSWKAQQGNGISPPKIDRVRNVCERNKLRKEALKNFLTGLPKMPSHYCRSKTSKLYIEPMWSNTSELYSTYAHHVGDLRLTRPIFNQVFNEMNLKLFRPRKDECEICVGYREKNISEDLYQEHRNRANSAQAEKAKDKIGPHKVIAVDVQSVLLTPKNNTSTIYYKTRLIVHNYTIYDLKTRDAFCYVWDETNGNLNASNYASMLVSFVSNNSEPGDTIIIYSDGCTSQNRNITLSNALLNLCVEKNVTIIQKILEKGHTQMEADSVHAAIEAQLRHKRINVPADLVEGMRAARKKNPYTVYHLTYDFFKDFDRVKLIKNNSIRPGFKTGDPVVTQVKAFKYTPSLEVYYKLDLSDDTPWRLLSDVQKKTKPSKKTCSNQSSPVPFTSLPPLYNERLKLSLEKFNDLQDLKITIDPDYHSFYDNLPHEIFKKKQPANHTKNICKTRSSSNVGQSQNQNVT